jgi:hypothetical protein
MQCPECNQPLMVANSKYESEQGSTEVYNVLKMVCVNPKCSNYAGTNLNEPLKVAATVRNKVG